MAASLRVLIVMPHGEGRYTVFAQLGDPTADIPIGATLARPGSPTIYKVVKTAPSFPVKYADAYQRGMRYFVVDSNDQFDSPEPLEHLSVTPAG